MSKFFVIEGLDGAGKSTQIELLKKYLHKKNLKYQFLHFPRTDCPIYGDLIARFLRGEFGTANEVNPYLVSLLYSGDRNDAKRLIRKWLKEGYLIFADRYYYSNVAFQRAKLRGHNEKEKLKSWLHKLEFDYNRIPSPNLSIFLHLPFNFITKSLKNARYGFDRHYLKGYQDIHEGSIKLQKNVEKEYRDLVKTEKDFYMIECFSKEGKVLNPSSINRKIIHLLQRHKIFEK